MPDARSTRLAQFTQWPLHWVVVRHFLSADLMEELSRALVSVASNGVLSFDALFESVQSAGLSALTCFILRPTPIDEPFGRCLQEVVRTIVWQSDQTVSFSDQGIKKEDAEFLREINIALTLSAIDFEAISSGSFRTASVA